VSILVCFVVFWQKCRKIFVSWNMIEISAYHLISSDSFWFLQKFMGIFDAFLQTTGTNPAENLFKTTNLLMHGSHNKGDLPLQVFFSCVGWREREREVFKFNH
jgi:hypothetical protein